MIRIGWLCVIPALLLVSVSAALCQSPTESARLRELIPGTRFRAAAWNQKTGKLCATAANQLDPCRTLTVDGVRYTVSFGEDPQDARFVLVSRVETSDRRFSTANGLRPGDSMRVAWSTLRVCPYFDVLGPEQPGGWIPVVGHAVLRNPAEPAPADPQTPIFVHVGSFIRASPQPALSNSGN